MPSSTLTRDLRKGDKVLAAADLRDVPAGTKGKIVIVNGLSWIRYWVRFDNGVTIGSVNRAHLATPDEWERNQNATDDAGGGPAADAGEAAGDGASEGDAGGGVTTPNGTVVPQKLIERAKAARARLGG